MYIHTLYTLSTLYIIYRIYRIYSIYSIYIIYIIITCHVFGQSWQWHLIYLTGFLVACRTLVPEESSDRMGKPFDSDRVICSIQVYSQISLLRWSTWEAINWIGHDFFSDGRVSLLPAAAFSASNRRHAVHVLCAWARRWCHWDFAHGRWRARYQRNENQGEFPWHSMIQPSRKTEPILEGSLDVKLPTLWTDGKAEVGRGREEKGRIKKIREEKASDERRCRGAKR